MSSVRFIEQSIEVLTPKDEYSQFSKRLEKIARVCYKSENKIKDGSDEILLNKIMAHGHGSVLEHMNLTIRLITDRGISHRFVRHRHTAFMQESTHYIDYHKKGEIVLVRQAGWDSPEQESIWEEAMRSMADYYEKLSLSDHAVAATVFPIALKTELVITTNILQWQHIMNVRSQPKCHPQTRVMAGLIIDWFKQELPFFVQQIETIQEMDRRVAVEAIAAAHVGKLNV